MLFRSPDFTPASRVLGILIDGEQTESGGPDNEIYIACNTGHKPTRMQLPPLPTTARKQWFLMVDTAASAPDDFREEGRESPLSGEWFFLRPRSIQVLISKKV